MVFSTWTRYEELSGDEEAVKRSGVHDDQQNAECYGFFDGHGYSYGRIGNS